MMHDIIGMISDVYKLFDIWSHETALLALSHDYARQQKWRWAEWEWKNSMHCENGRVSRTQSGTKWWTDSNFAGFLGCLWGKSFSCWQLSNSVMSNFTWMCQAAQQESRGKDKFHFDTERHWHHSRCHSNVFISTLGCCWSLCCYSHLLKRHLWYSVICNSSKLVSYFDEHFDHPLRSRNPQCRA